MKKVKGNTKRLLSLILAAAMVAGGVPQSVIEVSACEINNEVVVESQTDNAESEQTSEQIMSEETQTEETTVEGTEEFQTETAVEETEEFKSEEIQKETVVEEIEEVHTETNTEVETKELQTETIVEETEELQTETIVEEIEELKTETTVEETEEVQIEINTETEVSTEEVETEIETETIEDEELLEVAEIEDFVIENGVLTKYTSTAENVTIPEGTTKIDREAFSNNQTIKSVTFPDSLKVVDAQAFYQCSNLKTVNMNEGLEEIGYQAFYDVPFGEVKSTGELALGKLIIPGTVKAIGDAAFAKSEYLGEVIFTDGQNTVLEMYSSISQGTFIDCFNLKKVTLPKRLKNIPYYMFCNDQRLEEVVFGKNIQTIGERAFYNCLSMNTPVFNEGLVSIGAEAFYGVPCGKLKSTGAKELGKLTIPSTVQYIGRGAFQKCEYLGEIEFTNGETVVLTMDGNANDGVFSHCSNLEKVKLPERLKIISKYAFFNDRNLKEVEFGSKLTKIEKGAFENCNSMTVPVLPEGLVTIEYDAFKCASLGENGSNGKLKLGKLIIPSTVQFIGYGAFMDCDYLEEVDFINGETIVLRIEGWSMFGAFSNCNSLKKVRLPERLKQIEYHTFDSSKNLKAVLIPESVTKIGEYVFSYCSNITIYGTSGSAAETYAKNNKIPFKDKSEFDKDTEDEKDDDKSKTSANNAPKLNTNKISLNINEENPLATIYISPKNGYAVDQSSLVLTNNDAFEIVKAENSSIKYFIKIKSGKSVAKGKYKVFINVKTTAKEQNPYKLPITIQATQTIPKVTISQQKAVNVYEKDSAGEVYITSDTPIKNIKFTSSAGSNEPRLVQKDVNVEDGSFTYKLENVTGQNYKNIVAKGRLVVEFEGYKSSAAYSKQITLKLNKKLPVYNTEALMLFVDTELNNAAVKVINSSNKKVIKISDGYKVSLNQAVPSNYQVVEQTKESPFKIKVTNGAKSTTLKLLITNSKWIEGLGIPVKCKVTIGKKPVLAFSNSTVTLNTAYEAKKYNAVEIVPYIKGYGDFAFSKVEINGKNAKSNEVYNNGALILKYEKGIIEAEIADSSYFSKKGTYTYNVKATTVEGLTVNGTLKVNVATASPQLGIKASGSINLLDRKNSSIKYKISVKNFTGEIINMQLEGENANKFDITYNDGVMTLKAKTGVALSINKQYHLSVNAELTNGAEIKSNIKFKLKQKSPKLTTNVKKLIMFKSASGIGDGYEIAIKNVSGSKIVDIELANGYDIFEYKYADNGKGILYVADDTSGKTNKNYKLKLAVTLKDAADNTKPIYVTVQIKYMK